MRIIGGKNKGENIMPLDKTTRFRDLVKSQYSI